MQVWSIHHSPTGGAEEFALTLKRAKMLKSKIKYSDHITSAGGISLVLNKMKEITELAVQSTLRRFSM